MGIRFYCPNGHRLNVKDFLAGKRGICPHCESRFRIPRESEIPKGSPKVKPGSVAEATGTNGKRRSKKSVAVAGATPGSGSSDMLLKSDDDQNMVANQKKITDQKKVSEQKIAEQKIAEQKIAEQKIAEQKIAERKVGASPIDEAPDAVWYVRPPSGGQYGPAKGEIMRRWLAEGRVSSDSLVWREGWVDWQLAGPLFPAAFGGAVNPVPTSSARQSIPAQAVSSQAASAQAATTTKLATNSKSAMSSSAKADTLFAPGAPSGSSTALDRTPLASVAVSTNRGASKKKSVVAVVGLAVLIIVLAVVLVVVLVTKA